MSAADILESRTADGFTPGPRDWILDIYGSFVRDLGGWIAVADLLSLLELFGVSKASGRSALSRMKRRGEVSAALRGSTRGYALTDSADRWFADGTARIMNGTAQMPDDVWVVASFTVPEDDRHIRYKIRTRLQDLGFGQLAGGLMVAPASILGEARRALERADLAEYVDVWQGRHVGFKTAHEMVSQAWNLDSIRDAYSQYLALASSLAQSSPPSDDADSFVRYLINVNAWRDLPFIDPGIPMRFLPSDWPSAQARVEFHALANEYRPAALRHFVRIAASQ